MMIIKKKLKKIILKKIKISLKKIQEYPECFNKKNKKI